MESLLRLKEYVGGKRWKGYDPYDALNSSLLMAGSFRISYLRFIYTQILKRIPFNLRKLLLVRDGYNPKGMGLFLSAYIALYRATSYQEYLKKAQFFISWLINNSSNGYAGHCWGYNFPWQSKALFFFLFTPTIVNTSFIANAFLDAYEVLGEEKYLEIARSSCDFIIKSLNILRTTDEMICFSYTPLDNTKVHNANLLGASLLSRVYSVTKEDELLDYANRAVEFSCAYQNRDGSWYYGLDGMNKIDSYHTGFILESLYDFARFSGRSDIMEKLILGFNYYRDTFFTTSFSPKCYNNKTYPLDIHSAAESIIVFTKFRTMRADNLELAKKIALWAINNMQDQSGYFYYQKHRFYCNKISYMRWSQAWMFKALAYLCEALGMALLKRKNDKNRGFVNRNSNQIGVYYKDMTEKEFIENCCLALDVKPGTLNRDSSPDNVGTWDSMGYLSLISMIDKEFGISFEGEKLESFRNLGEIIDDLKLRGVLK